MKQHIRGTLNIITHLADALFLLLGLNFYAFAHPIDGGEAVVSRLSLCLHMYVCACMLWRRHSLTSLPSTIS